MIAFTVLCLPTISRTETSKVPPPKSKITHLLSLALGSLTSLQKVSAAAVGSLMMPLQSRPAILAAEIVDDF